MPAEWTALPPADRSGYRHPRSEAEICALVRHARERGLQVRVRGAGHSVPGAIHTDARLGGRGADAIEILLDRYAGVRFDEARRQVTVEAGCRFGRDPRDPTGRSTEEAGLCLQLDRRGWALPNLGGVAHQTVAGFLATGSAGGSVRYNLGDAVVGLRIVDGEGRVHDLSRDRDPDRFHAAGVSMGLLGVISTVTLQCEESYDLIGIEASLPVKRTTIDLFGDGEESLPQFLRRSHYARLLWWPQRGVNKVVLWQARRMTAADYSDETGPKGALERSPYRPFAPTLGTTLPAQAIAGACLGALGGWRAGLEQVAGARVGGRVARVIEEHGYDRMKGALINAFVPTDTRGPKHFRDTWWQGLPLDTGIDERLLPTTFTELWLPLSRAKEAMRLLRGHFEGSADAAGDFSTEIYAAGPSPFWMSPGHGEASLRFNFFWLEKNRSDPRERFFQRFWDLFEDLGFRLHWGKVMPLDTEATALYLARRYPRWDDFMRLRAEMDPGGIFLTAYWRAFLGVGPRAAAAPAMPLPDGRPFDRPTDVATRWPLAFDLEPSDRGLLATAEQTIDVRGHIAAAPGDVHEVLASLAENASWVPGFVRADWLTEPGVAADAVVDEAFWFMTLRVRVLESEPGRTWVASVDAASVPIATRMVQVVELEPAPDGGTSLRWRIAYDVPAPMKPMHRFVRPLFDRMFASAVRQLGELMVRRAGRDV